MILVDCPGPPPCRLTAAACVRRWQRAVATEGMDARRQRLLYGLIYDLSECLACPLGPQRAAHLAEHPDEPLPGVELDEAELLAAMSLDQGEGEGEGEGDTPTNPDPSATAPAEAEETTMTEPTRPTCRFPGCTALARQRISMTGTAPAYCEEHSSSRARGIAHQVREQQKAVEKARAKDEARAKETPVHAPAPVAETPHRGISAVEALTQIPGAYGLAGDERMVAPAPSQASSLPPPEDLPLGYALSVYRMVRAAQEEGA